MTRRREIGIAAALLLVAALVLMPMRIVFGGNGIAARKVEGLIWDGAVRDLRVGQVGIGDVNTRLHVLPLLLVRAQFSLSRGDAPFAPGVSGSITRSLGSVSVDDLKATLPVSTLFAPLPAESVELQDFSVRFRSGRCVAAGGNVRLTMTSSIPGLDLANGLLGKPRCDKGQLLIPLASQSAMEHVDIRLGGDGFYNATIFLEGNRAEQAAAIALAGFRPVSGGYRMVRKGGL